jgi:hypothetical protein
MTASPESAASTVNASRHRQTVKALRAFLTAIRKLERQQSRHPGTLGSEVAEQLPTLKRAIQERLKAMKLQSPPKRGARRSASRGTRGDSPLRIKVTLREEAHDVLRGKIPVKVSHRLDGRDGDTLVFLEGSKAALADITKPFFIVTLQRRRGRK